MGVAVVSDAAANGASCGEPAPVSPSWKLGGFTFRDDVPAPASPALPPSRRREPRRKDRDMQDEDALLDELTR